MQIGHKDSFADGVSSIKLNGKNLFLLKDGNKVRLYDSTCPHQGGTLQYRNNEFCCEVHNWRFDVKNGCSHNIRNAKLFEYKVWCDKDGMLHASIAHIANRDKAQMTGGGGKRSLMSSRA